MLEALVSSRIRRALLEHVLLHSTDRFYLRGLAKELGVSISPLRRELKRLEHAGMLSACQEGNMLFYAVQTASPVFLQLRQAGLGIGTTSSGSGFGVQGSGLEVVAQSPEPRTRSLQGIPIGVISADSMRPSWWRGSLRGPVLIGAAAAGMAVMVVVAGLAYFTLTNQQAASQVLRTLTARKADVTVVMPPSPASGAMRGRRWQIVPGGFGGFSSGTEPESY